MRSAVPAVAGLPERRSAWSGLPQNRDLQITGFVLSWSRPNSHEFRDWIEWLNPSLVLYSARPEITRLRGRDRVEVTFNRACGIIASPASETVPCR